MLVYYTYILTLQRSTSLKAKKSSKGTLLSYVTSTKQRICTPAPTSGNGMRPCSTFKLETTYLTSFLPNPNYGNIFLERRVKFIFTRLAPSHLACTTFDTMRLFQIKDTHIDAASFLPQSHPFPHMMVGVRVRSTSVICSWQNSIPCTSSSPCSSAPSRVNMSRTSLQPKRSTNLFLAIRKTTGSLHLQAAIHMKFKYYDCTRETGILASC
jgi:hypothetical protein